MGSGGASRARSSLRRPIASCNGATVVASAQVGADGAAAKTTAVALGDHLANVSAAHGAPLLGLQQAEPGFEDRLFCLRGPDPERRRDLGV